MNTVSPPECKAQTMSSQELAIARSVLYASLFDYPLTLAQLRQRLIESEQTPTQILDAYAASVALQQAIERRDGFFFPRGMGRLIDERAGRAARSRAFLRRHRVFLALAGAMPFVRMLALSGSIAHLNLEGDGDLDLFIVTRGRRVWLVTVAVVMLAKLVGRRRSVCANFVVSDSRLALDQHDLFTASQVLHLRPLTGLDVYQELVAANPFVRGFYPNYVVERSPIAFRRPWLVTAAKRGLEALLLVPSAAAEAVCRRAYRAYLLRRASTWHSPEQVRLEPDYLKLHTQSHRQSVLDRFERVMSELEGPHTAPRQQPR